MRFPPLTRSARKVINSDLQNKEKSRERPGVTAARAKREKRFFILTYHNRKNCGNGMGLPPLAQSARTIFHFDVMNHQNRKNHRNGMGLPSLARSARNFFHFLPTIMSIGGKNHKDGMGLPPLARSARNVFFILT